MTDLRSSTPTSDIFTDDGGESTSLRDKVLLKRSISKHHNNNFKAGYVPVNEQHLSKTGLRGRKTFAFWTLVGLLFILAVGNLMLTTIILGVLRLGQGMASIELVPEAQSIKFFGDTDLGDLYKRDGKIEGYADEPISLTAVDGNLRLNLTDRYGRPVTKLRMSSRNGTVLSGFETFEVKNRQGDTIFSLNSPHLNQLSKVNSLKTKMVSTNRIASPVNGKLRIQGQKVGLKGAEGTRMDGKEIVWSADRDIYLKSINGSIVLSDRDGIFIDGRRIPIATVTHNNYFNNDKQFKVCVCMPQGKLFKIPLVNQSNNNRVYCHHIDMSPQHNPCI